MPQYANDIWQPAFIALFLNIFTSLKPCTVSVGSCVSIRLWALKYRLCLSSLSRPVYPCEAFYIGRANAETRRVDSIIWMFEFPRWGLAFRLTKRPVRGESQNARRRRDATRHDTIASIPSTLFQSLNLRPDSIDYGPCNSETEWLTSLLDSKI